ncbi:hypothetical protein MAPG_04851 [Magnaporthiopsis poae ATCC 64411]|uniref:RTA1 domain-containing protein n=1 Tax=Magnaporthiopsis poae (strain ATCC 64411 / 73-15) TaxID=644358 RepID=A0A0C4DXU4_MAGP6|nr:hypothetical protein MAPG_04851 [Magnaporthiopsis poae ATCC 64411]
MATNATASLPPGVDPAAFDFQLYRYVPDLPAAIASIAIFAILTALHFWRIARHRSYYFLAFAVGGIFEVIGYIGRALSHGDKYSLGPFIMQSLLILLAPALFAASIYAILGRLIVALRADHLAPIRPSRTTQLFVGGDVISFLLQMAGGGLQAAGTLEFYHQGEKIILTGLFIQMAFFSFFIFNAVVFHTRLSGQPPLSGIPWQRHLYVLYAVSVVILVRNLFRVVEYLQGNGGYLVSHEVFLYIFDMALMAVVMAIFLIWYVDDLSVDSRKTEEDGVLSELTTFTRSRGNSNRTA